MCFAPFRPHTCPQHLWKTFIAKLRVIHPFYISVKQRVDCGSYGTDEVSYWRPGFWGDSGLQVAFVRLMAWVGMMAAEAITASHAQSKLCVATGYEA